MTETNPYAVLEILDQDRWPEGYDPIEAAFGEFEPEDLKRLTRLLHSSIAPVSSRGLRLFGMLGRKAYPVLNDALHHVGHPHVMARHGLMDGLLCYPEKLTASQVRQVLLLKDLSRPSSPPAQMVQGNAIVVLGFVGPVVIAEAIGMIEDERLREHHILAFCRTSAEFTDLQQAFDDAKRLSGLKAAYAFADLIWSARKGQVSTAVVYDGEDYVSGIIAAVIRRIINKKLRRDDPEAWSQQLVDQRKNRSAFQFPKGNY